MGTSGRWRKVRKSKRLIDSIRSAHGSSLPNPVPMVRHSRAVSSPTAVPLRSGTRKYIG
ncbi:Uncharacterised protein [Mycobacteroides abscessus subsp. abscessus]|nr:Uncharacterised protein [Mycobacteroides abscessus subsp. abscessus]